MNLLSRRGLMVGMTAALLLAGCSTFSPPATTQERAALAPSGKLRVGVYLGSPTSLVIDAKTGEKNGVAYALGRELAMRLQVPFEPVEFKRVAEVIEAMRAGTVDFTVTNASASRAKLVDFTEPLVDLELGYLVAANSAIKSLDDVDRPGMQIGVSQGSTSQGVLTARFKQAKVIAAPNLKTASEWLSQGKINAFATNKGILFEMSDGLAGSRVLDGNWGSEHLAIAVPKAREAGREFVARFALSDREDGTLRQAISQAGLRGTTKPNSP